MKLTIEGSPKEIAALVPLIQARQTEPTPIDLRFIECKCNTLALALVKVVSRQIASEVSQNARDSHVIQ